MASADFYTGIRSDMVSHHSKAIFRSLPASEKIYRPSVTVSQEAFTFFETLFLQDDFSCSEFGFQKKLN